MFFELFSKVQLVDRLTVPPGSFVDRSLVKLKESLSIEFSGEKRDFLLRYSVIFPCII